MEHNTADLTNIELNDLHLINILLCYLLYRIKEPVTPDALYDIAVSTGIINYFYYQDSLDFLTKNGSLELKPDKKGKACYMLTPQGELCALRLKQYVPKIFRDKLVLRAHGQGVLRSPALSGYRGRSAGYENVCAGSAASQAAGGADHEKPPGVLRQDPGHRPAK